MLLYVTKYASSKIYNFRRPIINSDLKFVNVLCDKLVCVPYSFNHRKLRAVEIFGTEVYVNRDYHTSSLPVSFFLGMPKKKKIKIIL